MWRSIYQDPIPTPAGRTGRHGMTLGLIGWGFLLTGILLYLVSLWLHAQEHLATETTFRVAAGWAAGMSVIFYFAGVLFAAAGTTQKIHGIQDPGMVAVYWAFTLNLLPMIVVAVLAAYDRYGPLLLSR